jgi:hypothetical protein
MSQHLETFILRVIFWGGICHQPVMAVEIGTMRMGSLMLLIPVV